MLFSHIFTFVKSCAIVRLCVNFWLEDAMIVFYYLWYLKCVCFCCPPIPSPLPWAKHLSNWSLSDLFHPLPPNIYETKLVLPNKQMSQRANLQMHTLSVIVGSIFAFELWFRWLDFLVLIHNAANPVETIFKLKKKTKARKFGHSLPPWSKVFNTWFLTSVTN